MPISTSARSSSRTRLSRHRLRGQPLRTIDDRRRPDSPLRDVASLLRSLDHVARSARRRAEAAGRPLERPGLDVDAWIERARERFLAAYVAGCGRRTRRSPSTSTSSTRSRSRRSATSSCMPPRCCHHGCGRPATGCAGCWRTAREASLERRTDAGRGGCAEEILVAPDELAAAIDLHRRGIAALPDGLLERPRWVLIGMGSSGFAARDAEPCCGPSGMRRSRRSPPPPAARHGAPTRSRS